MFAVLFDQFNVSMLNKSINFLINLEKNVLTPNFWILINTDLV